MDQDVDQNRRIDYNRPIAIFYANLLWHGVRLTVADGQLRVGGDLTHISPVYREEIVRRKEQLIDLLSTSPPPELASYFGRVISVQEVVEAMGIANQMKVKVKQLPVQGGWLLFMARKVTA